MGEAGIAGRRLKKGTRIVADMHYRGKDFTYTAVYPDGRSETLLKLPAYDFNWQTVYELAVPLEMPKGSRIDCVAHFDNSKDNPFNPDPTRDVTFGSESFDEMMIGFVDYTVKDGLRPMTAEQRLEVIRAKLVASDSNAVFALAITASEGDQTETIDTVLRFSPEEGSQWFVPVNGEVWEGTLVDIEGDASGFTATLKIPFGNMQVEGAGAFGGADMSGTIKFGPQDLTFVASLISN
ncbi:MAG: hypothetical protein VYE73_06305 [Acidobacteriota bacterium]|nr:hypothetical protein [Acidobacteriota bacterium]